MKDTIRKKNKRKLKRHNKTQKEREILVLTGGNIMSYFLPSTWAPGWFGPKKEEPIIETKNPLNDKTENTTDKKDTDKDKKDTDKDKKDKKNIKPVNVRELYKTEKDYDRIDKQFYDNPNITTWCFDDPGYKPVGIVHVTSVVGINVVRTLATTIRNYVGVKGTIDENMHRLRNEIYNEMENVMDVKRIDKICHVGVAFTKDSGSLILSAFGTALRKIGVE